MGLAGDLLLGPGGQLAGFLDRSKLQEHLRQQRDPQFFHVYQVWELLVLEQWLRKAAMQTARVPAAA